MKPTPELISRLQERFGHAVIAYVDMDGYPMSVATDFQVDSGPWRRPPAGGRR